MSATSPDVLMDPITGDLPDFVRWVRGPEITAQRVECRLQTHVGDWQLQAGEGIAWDFWLESGDLAGLAGALASEILDTAGVADLQDLDWSIGGGDLTEATITATVITTDGTRIPLTVTPLSQGGNPSIALGAVLAPRGKIVPR